MNLKNLFNNRPYLLDKQPTGFQRIVNYFLAKSQFWIEPGNDLTAAIRTIAIHINKSEEQVLRQAIDIGISTMEEIVTEQASYYRKEDGSNELVKLILKDEK